MIPRRVGRYPVVEEIGRGAMGIVYLVEDLELGRRIALKVLADHLSNEPAAQARFRSEARLLAAVDHPAIAGIHSLESSGGVQWITMEYIPGDNLADLIAAGSITMDQAVDIARQVAGALESAHQKGVIHRDLKPRNIRITPDGRVKVLDFGLAALLVDPEAETLSLSHSEEMTACIAGTAGYMSPQQLRGQAPDPRDDVWAFGCVFFELLTGVPAFPGGTPVERISATLTAKPPLDRLPMNTSPRVRELLTACFAEERNARPASFRDLRRLLEEEHALRLLGSSKTALQPEVSVKRTNVPRHLSPLVGRDDLAAQVRNLILERRIVTLVGTAGCGKSRVAMEVARALADERQDGAWYVDVAGIDARASLYESVVEILVTHVVPETTSHGDPATCLRERDLLLLLDNYDHRLEEIGDCVHRLLQETEAVRILCAGRERLATAGETVCRVPPLGDAGIELFLERAAWASAGLEPTEDDRVAIEQICQHLDGLPLAILMAASLANVLPVREIAARLDEDLRVLKGHRRDVSPRHRSLLAACNWSYELLSHSECTLFHLIAHLPDPWTLEDVRVAMGEELADWEIVDLVSRLVERSLVEPDWTQSRNTGRVHYRMLDTLRRYALTRETET